MSMATGEITKQRWSILRCVGDDRSFLCETDIEPVAAMAMRGNDPLPNGCVLIQELHFQDVTFLGCETIDGIHISRLELPAAVAGESIKAGQFVRFDPATRRWVRATPDTAHGKVQRDEQDS